MGVPADTTAALTPIPRGQGRFFLRASPLPAVLVCGNLNGVADLRSPAGKRRQCFSRAWLTERSRGAAGPRAAPWYAMPLFV
jgi:hypothetical protein